MNQTVPDITQQYQQENLYENIISSLKNQEVDLENLTWQQLASVDEFHVRGLEATLEMAQEASLRSGTKVLDVGCGIGGAARLLAAQYDCVVTGVDLTPEYIRTAKLLSEKVGLTKNLDFIQADALEMPFPDDAFAVVWTQHVQMNIKDKTAFYEAIARVLQSEGRFIYYDIFCSIEEALDFPVPWADDKSMSFLITRSELEQTLRACGLEEVVKKDLTEKGLQWFRQLLDRIREKGIPPLSLQLLMSASFVAKLENMVKNIKTGRIVLQSGIYQKVS